MNRWRTRPTETTVVEVQIFSTAVEGWLTLGFVPKDQALQFVQEFVAEMATWNESLIQTAD